MYKLLVIAILLTSCAVSPSSAAQQFSPSITQDKADEGFASWLAAYKKRALRSGISEQTINDSITISKPIAKVIALDKKQPEHKLTMEEYMANVINNARIEKGRQLMQDNAEVLADVSQRFGVEPEFIVALWGMETSYGKNTGGFGIVNALATLAYEGRRREFFESELTSALLIIEQGHISASEMKGSWAGAMGQCQFMPSSYLAYAIDYNQDGKTDIWNSKKDVLASIANYLYTVGWSKDTETKRLALMHWNRSKYFVASVFKLAEEIKDEKSINLSSPFYPLPLR